MKYILILILCAVLVRFLNSLVRLGSEKVGKTRIRNGSGIREPATRNPAEGRDVEDAEFEILPGEEVDPPDSTG